MGMKGIGRVLLVALSLVSTGLADEAIRIGSRRELFVDRTLVDRLEGRAELRLHQPVPREVAIVHDAPWEGNASAYHTVFQDGHRYRMYYRGQGLSVANGQLEPTHETLCYAESDDGVHWRRPELGLHEFQGNKANNIVLTTAAATELGVTIGGPAVFRDNNPQTPAAARYKLFLTSRSPLGMRPFQSADGIHWSPMSGGPTVQDGGFDSQNLAFWDAARGEYRAYWRYFTHGVTTASEWKPDGIRSIRTATSADLVNWNHQANLTYGEAPEEQLYENGVAPYHRAPHLLLGFPVRYIDRGVIRHSTSPGDGSDALTPEQLQKWSTSLRALPDYQQRAARARLSERFGSALTETLFMASRDGVKFQRWDEAFIRPGMERTGTWNYGQNFVAWGLVETQSPLDESLRELSFYATEGYWTAKATSLRRYTLRLDGFVSLHAPMSGGKLVTRPLVFQGKSLSLNFATSAAGTIRVALLSSSGEPLSGFGLEDCDVLFGDTIDRIVTWKGKSDVSAHAEQSLQLQFEVRDGDLYSFQFQ